MDSINLDDKFSRFTETWTPKILAELNGDYVKIAKGLGEMPWHAHENEDELFLVIQGQLTIRLRDREVSLGPGELFVVPRGVEHSPYAETEAHFLMVEPKSTAHTGDNVGETTVAVRDQEWI